METYVNETDELIHVFINGEEIVTTPSHPFYSPVKGWTDAVQLRAGDILVLVNGEYVVVEKVQHEILDEPVTVYNFQVEDYHGHVVTPESLGNYAYGFLGYAYGFNLEVLLGGSYYAADFPTGGTLLANEFIDWVYITIGYSTAQNYYGG